MLENELGKSCYEEKFKNGELAKVAVEMNYKTFEDLLASLGYGETTCNKVVNKLKRNSTIVESSIESFTKNRGSKKKDGEIEGLEGMLYSFAKCCSPVPGEPIVGVVTCSKGVSIHRLDCNSLENVPKERLMNIKWSDNQKSKTYTTSIRIDVMDKLGILKEILSTITDCNSNVTYANVKSNLSKKIGIIYLGIEVDNVEKLQKVINCLQNIEEVYSVKRVSVNNCIRSSAKQKNKQQKTKNKKS